MKHTRLQLLLACTILHLGISLVVSSTEKKRHIIHVLLSVLYLSQSANIKTKTCTDYTLKLKVQDPKEKNAKGKEHFNS